MTSEDQENLVRLGSEIDCLVTPFQDCGVLGVFIGSNLHTFSVARAKKELLMLAANLQFPRCA